MRISLLMIFLFSLSAYSDTGFYFNGDLNGDGIDDSIQSGPSEMFGSGGGPCVLTVSILNGASKKEIISCHISGIILEESTDKFKPSRLWQYSRFNPGEGSISSITLDGDFKVQSMTLYLDTTSVEGIGTGILKAIKEKGRLIKFEQDEDYVPPDNPCGVQWGKGC